jgi:hypothetical protein
MVFWVFCFIIRTIVGEKETGQRNLCLEISAEEAKKYSRVWTFSFMLQDVIKHRQKKRQLHKFFGII